jgi:hypothetical protein
MSFGPRPAPALALLCTLLAACDASGDDDDTADASLPQADADPAAPDADPAAPDANPAAPDAAPAASCPFENDIVYDLLAETVQLESADKQTCVKLTRRNDCAPDVICKAVPFTLLTFLVVHDGTLTYIDKAADLHWEATHHNWMDWGEAIGGGVRYRLDSRYTDGFTDHYELAAAAVGTGAGLWGPIELFPYVKP